MTTTPSVATDHGRVSYAETGSGEPLVILHSLLTDRRAFDGVIPSLPGRVIALDLPGYGLSDRAASSIEAFADQMAAAIAHICDEPATVMGNGLGAFVALGLAIRHPELVSRLVLVGAGATFPEEARPAFANMAQLVGSNGMSAVTPTALHRIFTDEFLDAHPEEAAERARVLEAADPEVFVTACLALQKVDFTKGSSSLAIPTLIVVGDEDQATPPAMAAFLDGLLPDSRVVVLPGIAHAPQLQDPEGFIETISSFLEEE
jgi:3-oxoadipate enol-lactonase